MEMKFLQGVNSPEYGGQLSRNMQWSNVVIETHRNMLSHRVLVNLLVGALYPPSKGATLC